VHQLAIRAGARNQQAATISNRHATHEPTAGDGRVHDWYVISQLLLKDAVKILASANRHKGVCVCEVGEDPNLVTIFELTTTGHGFFEKRKKRLVPLSTVCCCQRLSPSLSSRIPVMLVLPPVARSA